MVLRRLILPLAASLALAGCAHFPDVGYGETYAGASHKGAGGWTSVVHPAGGPLDELADAKGGPWAPQTLTYAALPRGPQAVADSDGPYLLDTGDRLRVFVFGQPNLSRIYPVDHAGNIVVPLIGKVRARGKTVYSLARSIRNRLGAQFVRDPQVTVDINQNRPFFIMGEVRNPGQFPYVNGMTVQQAVAIGGGYSERARRGLARITRRINGFVEVLDVPSDYVLKPGDVVEIDERFF